MKSIIFVISLIICLSKDVHRTLYLEKDILYNDKTDDIGLKYFQIPLERSKNLHQIKDAIIETEMINKPKDSSAVLLVSKRPFPNFDKEEHFVFKNFGKEPCKIQGNFLKNSPNRKLNIAVYCKNCDYNIKIHYEEPSADSVKDNEIRLLQENTTKSFQAAVPTSLSDPTHVIISDKDRLDFFCGDGIGVLIVIFIMIFVCIVVVKIMMSIYVHTTLLVEEPLKLGRVEA